MEQSSILIRDRASRRVVTIIELLSPINKVPPPITGAIPLAWAEFLAKRQATMASTTHWMELDRLRAGERSAEVRGLADYYVLAKRAGASQLDVWPSGLRDPLPVVAVPLVAPDDDVPLDLQAALDLLFARYRYAELLDYDAPARLAGLVMAFRCITARPRWRVSRSTPRSPARWARGRALVRATSTAPRRNSGGYGRRVG